MRFDFLHNQLGLYLVDARVEAHQVSCGWCYADTHLPEIVALYNGAIKVAEVHIPEPVQASKLPITCYFKDSTVDFLRYA